MPKKSVFKDIDALKNLMRKLMFNQTIDKLLEYEEEAKQGKIL